MLFSIRNFLNTRPTTKSNAFGTRHFSFLCCLALILFNIGCNNDSAQWKVAAAINEKKNANPEGAIELYQAALRMDPESPEIKIRLANLLAENDQGDLGLTLCDEVLESDPNFQLAWHVRSNCLTFLGRFDEALADYQKCCAGNSDKNWLELNQLAYHRGLAGFELDKALRQANRGIGKFQQQQIWGGFSIVPLEISSIVSASLISRHLDDGHLLVQDLLNESISERQQIWLERDAFLDRVEEIHEEENQTNFGDETEELRTNRQRKELEQASKGVERASGNLAVLLATRSLLFEDQGKSKLADLDRLWLKRINVHQQIFTKFCPMTLSALKR